MEIDPYKVLGVSKSSSKEEINKAFRSLASKYHPDKNPDDKDKSSAKFKEINAAFEIIGDENKRRQYDLQLENNFSTFSFRNRNSVDEIFNNMFSHFFGDQRPNVSKARVKITFEESYFGCSKLVDIENHAFCESCKGTGSSSWESCAKCSGKGFFSVSKGSFVAKSSCVACGGKGSIPIGKCDSCSGVGYISTGSKSVQIDIPAGIENGSQIRISQESDDYFVYVIVEKNPFFERNNSTIYSRIKVSYPKLVLGGIEEFSFLGSKINLNIPKRSMPNKKLRIKGKGMPLPQNPNLRGDLIIELILEMPENLTSEHEYLLSKLMNI